MTRGKRVILGQLIITIMTLGIPYVEERKLFIHPLENKVRPGTYIYGCYLYDKVI